MMFKQKRTAITPWWLLAAGVLAGVAITSILTLRRRRQRLGRPAGESGQLEDQVIRALRADQTLRARGIDVAVIAPGIVELTGFVETENEAHHAVNVAQSVIGARTVLNRLEHGDLEQRLRRQRRRERAEANAASRWYGMGVGMGRRRQARTTDPDRRDDHADMVEAALAPNAEQALADVAEERDENL
jgi:hypothetical protein